MTKSYHDMRLAPGHADHPSPEVDEQIAFVTKYHIEMREDGGAIAGGGEADLSAGGYRR